MPKALKKTFVRKLYSAISEALKNSGFTKRREGIFTRKLSEDTFGWLGLQTKWRSPDLEIFPIVGVGSQSVERQVALLRNLPGHDSLPTGVSIHLGYLGPEHRSTVWVFPMEKNVSRQVSALVDSVKKFGVPFMERNSSLAALCETMASGKIGISHQIAYSLPVAYCLLGRLGDAEAHLEAELKKLGDANHDAAKLYRKFAEAFRNHYLIPA